MKSVNVYTLNKGKKLEVMTAYLEVIPRIGEHIRFEYDNKVLERVVNDVIHVFGETTVIEIYV